MFCLFCILSEKRIRILANNYESRRGFVRLKSADFYKPNTGIINTELYDAKDSFLMFELVKEKLWIMKIIYSRLKAGPSCESPVIQCFGPGWGSQSVFSDPNLKFQKLFIDRRRTKKVLKKYF
jgi:hypothetical protein